MKNKRNTLIAMMFIVGIALIPDLAMAGLESSLIGLKSKLTGVILPVLSVIGIAMAAISFFTGKQNAKQHIAYAVMGCILVLAVRPSSISFHKPSTRIHQWKKRD